MPDMTIQLRINPDTGKKDIFVSLSGESDSLPHEHEQQHKRLVDQLIEGGMLNASEVGKVVVEREAGAEIPTVPPSSTPETLYIQRKMAGLYLLGRRLKAEVDLQNLLKPYLHDCDQG